MKCKTCNQEIVGKHYDDLTKIDVPFNQLDASTQSRLKDLPDEATQITGNCQPYKWGRNTTLKAHWNSQPYRQDPEWIDPKTYPPKPDEAWLKKNGLRLKEDKPRAFKKMDLVNAAGIHNGSTCMALRNADDGHVIAPYDGVRWILEKVSHWVECDVTVDERDSQHYVFSYGAVGRYCLEEAIGMVGFGGIQYEDESSWFSAPKVTRTRPNGPAKPVKVRFWKELP